MHACVVQRLTCLSSLSFTLRAGSRQLIGTLGVDPRRPGGSSADPAGAFTWPERSESQTGVADQSHISDSRSQVSQGASIPEGKGIGPCLWGSIKGTQGGARQRSGSPLGLSRSGGSIRQQQQRVIKYPWLAFRSSCRLDTYKPGSVQFYIMLLDYLRQEQPSSGA